MTVKKARRQWPEAILLVAGSFRAGLNMSESLELLLAQSPEPLRTHLRQKITQDWKAIALEKKIALLFSDPLLALVRAALLLSHQTGAEQAKLLETCSRLLREQFEFEEKVDVLTAQGRWTAWIVGLSPLGLLGSMLLLSPELMMPLFQTKLGQEILAVSLLSQTLGLTLVHHMARIRS